MLSTAVTAAFIGIAQLRAQPFQQVVPVIRQCRPKYYHHAAGLNTNDTPRVILTEPSPSMHAAAVIVSSSAAGALRVEGHRLRVTTNHCYIAQYATTGVTAANHAVLNWTRLNSRHHEPGRSRRWAINVWSEAGSLPIATSWPALRQNDG